MKITKKSLITYSKIVNQRQDTAPLPTYQHNTGAREECFQQSFRDDVESLPSFAAADSTVESIEVLGVELN